MTHKKFVPINLVSELTWEEFSKLNANLHKLDGIFPRIGTKRSYTAGESHSHLIGYIAPITKDEKNNIQKNIDQGIRRIKTFQLKNGGFSYWPNYSSSVSEWGTNYAGHFLIEAKNNQLILSSTDGQYLGPTLFILPLNIGDLSKP